MIFLCLVYVACLLSLCECQGAGGPGDSPSGGDYVLNFKSAIYVCDDDMSRKFVDTAAVEANQFNESVACLTGYVDFLIGMEPETMVEIKIEKIEKGRSEMMFSLEICDFCSELGDEESQYRSYLNSFGFPRECPFDAGTFQIENLVADTGELPINAANSGSFTATLTVNKDKDGSCKNLEFFACIAFDFAIELA